jgi:hypothetical protein
VCGSWYDTGRERTQFLELMHDDPSRRPTADAALERLRQLDKNSWNSKNGMDGRKSRGGTSKHRCGDFYLDHGPESSSARSEMQPDGILKRGNNLVKTSSIA